jgi:peptide/nickel transport system substrate-binding protein
MQETEGKGKMKKTILVTVILTTLLALLTSACGPSAPTAAPEEDKPAPTEAPAEDTPVPPAPTAAPEPTPEPPEETSITVLIQTEPSGFNGIVSDTGLEQFLMEFVMLSVTDLDPQGEIFPQLAAELPTEENGGVVVDWDAWTMDVTWKLRDDVYWADGEQVTSDDVIFTWDAITDPETGIWAEGTDYTDSLEKIDDQTFVVHYNTVYPNYLMQFGGENYGVWPEHYCDASQGFVAWDCNREPLSNGPYILDEWVTDDHLTFVANPNYYEEGKPLIDKIMARIVPDYSVAKTMMLEGDGDYMLWTLASQIEEFEAAPNVRLDWAPTGRWLQRLLPNHAAKGTTDPVSNPHPVLADAKVRHAIRMAIDVDTIVEEVYYGVPEPVWTEFFRSPYECEIPRPQFDPAGAAALLEEAGWTDEDGDGVRECHGCPNAEEGYPMSIELFGVAGYGEQEELSRQLIGEALGDIGIEAELSNVESTVLWSDYASGGLEQGGDFDLDFWSDGYPGRDPTDHIWYYYHSAAAVPDGGWNVARWMNEDADALIDSTYTLDEEARKEAFCELAVLMEEELPHIWLWTSPWGSAVADRLQGTASSVADVNSWNVADWYVED